MAEQSLAQLRKQAESEGTLTAGGSVLPEGEYVAEVVKSTTKLNEKEKRQFILQFKVLTGPEKNGTVWDTITISPESPKALGISFGQIDVLGGTAAIERDDADGAAAAMLGAVVTIKTYVDSTYNPSKPTAKVRFINPAPAGAVGSVAAAPTAGGVTGNSTPF